MNVAKREKTAQLTSLLIEDELQRMLEEEDHDAVHMVLPPFSSSTDERLGFEERCDLTRGSSK